MFGVGTALKTWSKYTALYALTLMTWCNTKPNSLFVLRNLRTTQNSNGINLFCSFSNIYYKNKARSVTIVKGCTMEAFDDTNFAKHPQKFTATDKDLHVNLGSKNLYKVTI